MAGKNRLPTSSSVTKTDNDSLQWHPCLRAPMHSCLQIIHVYMHVRVLLYDPAVQYDWWLAAQSPRAAPCCSSPPWSVPISPVLLQTGHPFPARKSPISPHVPYQAEECRPQAPWAGLSSPKACVAQLIDFFPSRFISLYPVALCQIVSLTKKKLNWYYL